MLLKKIKIFVWLLGAGIILFSALGYSHTKHTDKDGQVTYLGNEGLLIVAGEHKILFDPFFHNDYGIYQLVPEDIREKILKGLPPYDGVHGVFISHAHGDHFSAKDVVTFLKNNPKANLIAPQQAVNELLALPGVDLEQNRIKPIALTFGQTPAKVEVENLYIDAVRIPHAGWPGRADIENLVFRVRLENGQVVMHMGDADPNVEHYIPFKPHWSEMTTDTAFPPYWFFHSMEGRDILDSYLNVNQSIGVHVPVEVPAFLIKEAHPYFSKPGETRGLSHQHTH